MGCWQHGRRFLCAGTLWKACFSSTLGGDGAREGSSVGHDMLQAKLARVVHRFATKDALNGLTNSSAPNPACTSFLPLPPIPPTFEAFWRCYTPIPISHCSGYPFSSISHQPHDQFTMRIHRAAKECTTLRLLAFRPFFFHLCLLICKTGTLAIHRLPHIPK